MKPPLSKGFAFVKTMLYDLNPTHVLSSASETKFSTFGSPTQRNFQFSNLSNDTQHVVFNTLPQ